MSFLDRIFRSNSSRAYDEGLALFEQGRYGEAVAVLRPTLEEGQATRADSLGGNLLRRALVGEGRRLLRAGTPGEAIPFLEEAASIWDSYPDLQWWHGTALGLAGRWEEALQAARNALRRNPEYPEARLLEAAALTGLNRNLEAVTSLTALKESGRRNDHWLTRQWDGITAFVADALPDNLPELLERVIKGESEKEKLAAAVALCRAGDWEQGTTIFRELAARRPKYPDYRTRLAAALFHMRRLAEALTEVESALALHPGYAAALDLKTLILADQGNYQDAWSFQTEHADERSGQNPSSLEALFGSYLRGVLALMLGRPGEVTALLERWNDLVHDFAWAELLGAAADHTRGRRKSCGLRLESLVSAWPGDPEYAFLLTCFAIENGDPDRAAAILENWPRDDIEGPDQRLLFLQTRLTLMRGQIPDFPLLGAVQAAPDVSVEQSVIPRILPATAWSMLEAEAAFIRGDDESCWTICRELEAAGLVSERSLDIMLQCVSGVSDSEAWKPAPLLPYSCLTGAYALALRRGDPKQAQDLLRPVTALHPDMLVGMFLKPDFWLKSVRRWLS